MLKFTMFLQFFNNILLNKYSLIVTFLLIFKLPIIQFTHFIFLILFLLLILSIEEFKKIKKINFIIMLLFIISILYLFEKKTIIENHGIFLPSNSNGKVMDLDDLKKYINNTDDFVEVKNHRIYIPRGKNMELYLKENYEVYNLLIYDFYNSFQSEDLYLCKNQPSRCWREIPLNKVYTRSFDQIKFGEMKYSRKVENIYHYGISSARIGDINSNRLNWFGDSGNWWDKKETTKIKRINAPYIMQYIFTDDKYLNSEICWKGKAIVSNKPNIIHNKEIKCNKINKDFKILFYNFNNELEVKLHKSLSVIIFDIIFELLKIISLFIIIYLTVKKINISRIINHSIISIFSIFTIVYNILSRNEFSFGYQPLQGGMDGLVHEGLGRDIYESFLNMNFTEALKGFESIFYFMPGLRYFTAFEKFIFGDNHFGIYLILIFLAIVFYTYFLQLKFSNKFAILLTLAFIILKIPHLGFSYQHYVRNLLTLYPETLAIFSFFLCLIFLHRKNYFLSGISCFVMIFLRPNYFPAFIIINIFNILLSLKYNNISGLIFFLLGSSFFLLIPLHNYIFGERALVLFVQGSGVSRLNIYPFEYLYMFYDYDYYLKILKHLNNLLTTGMKNNFIVYFVNSALLLNLIFYYLFNFKKIYNYNVFFCLIALFQITPSFFYDNTDRYAYFSWLLISISNIFIIREYYNILKKINRQEIV